MKKTLFLLLLGFSTSVLASSCKYEVETTKLLWTAFKTPEKVAVSGTFKNMKVNFKSSESLSKLLSSGTINIVTAHIDSKNQERDKKLVNDFFRVQAIRTIDAKVLHVDKKSVDIEIFMNGIRKTITMNLVNDKNAITLNGTINLADFSMLPALNSLTKACYEPHKGKTWQDVDIKFIINTSCK